MQLSLPGIVVEAEIVNGGYQVTVSTKGRFVLTMKDEGRLLKNVPKIVAQEVMRKMYNVWEVHYVRPYDRAKFMTLPGSYIEMEVETGSSENPSLDVRCLFVDG